MKPSARNQFQGMILPEIVDTSKGWGLLTQEVVNMGQPRRAFTWGIEAGSRETGDGWQTSDRAGRAGFWDRAESVTALEARSRWRSGRRLSRQGTAQTSRRGAGPAEAGSGPRDAGAGFFKKCGGVLRQAVGMRCQAIRAHIGRVPVRLMCRLLAVSTSGYYAWVARPRVSARQRIDGWLPRFGSSTRSRGGPRQPRVHATLQLKASGSVNTVLLGSCTRMRSTRRRS